MMFMICCRVTPSLTVKMTITSVVFGVGASEGNWPDATGDCAAAANGYAERINGSKKFIVTSNQCFSVIGVWRSLVSARTTWCSQTYSRPLSERGLSALRYCGFLLMLQKKPECQDVRDEQQRHDQRGNEVSRAQLPRREAGGIGLV